MLTYSIKDLLEVHFSEIFQDSLLKKDNFSKISFQALLCLSFLYNAYFI